MSEHQASKQLHHRLAPLIEYCNIFLSDSFDDACYEIGE